MPEVLVNMIYSYIPKFVTMFLKKENYTFTQLAEYLDMSEEELTNALEQKTLELRSILGVSPKEDLKVEHTDVQLPKDFKHLIADTSLEARRAKVYLKKRGITETELIKYNIGHATNGQYGNHIIVPSYDKQFNINYSIDKIKHGSFNDIIKNEKDGRIHHIWVLMKSDAWPLFRLRGKPYSRILDIRACHPTFWALFILDYLCKKKMCYERNDISTGYWCWMWIRCS